MYVEGYLRICPNVCESEFERECCCCDLLDGWIDGWMVLSLIVNGCRVE